MELHRLAEEHVARAESLETAGDLTQAREHFLNAAEEEALAFDRIPTERARTRGIIAVSVVSLYWRAGEYDRAILAAHRYLSQPDIAPPAREDLENLLLDVRRSRTAKQSEMSYTGRTLELSLRGRFFQNGLAELDTLLLKYEQIRRLLIRATEWSAKRPFRLSGPPPTDVTRLAQPYLGVASPGSYKVQLHIQSPIQPTLFPLDGGSPPSGDEITDTLLNILRVTSAGEPEALAERVPDMLYRDIFVKLVRNLAPSGTGLDEMQFSDQSRRDQQPILLTLAVRRSIEHLMPHVPRQVEEPEPVGTLRALDLDRNRLTLVESGAETRYSIVKGAVFDDLVGPYVNRRVRLLGQRQGKRFVVDDIELAEPSPSTNGSE